MEAAKVVGPQAKWLGAGQGTLGLAFILYIIGESTGLDFFSALSGLSCVAGVCSFMIAGVVYGSAATAAGAGAAGVAGSVCESTGTGYENDLRTARGRFMLIV